MMGFLIVSSRLFISWRIIVRQVIVIGQFAMKLYKLTSSIFYCLHYYGDDKNKIYLLENYLSTSTSRSKCFIYFCCAFLVLNPLDFLPHFTLNVGR